MGHYHSTAQPVSKDQLAADYTIGQNTLAKFRRLKGLGLGRAPAQDDDDSVSPWQVPIDREERKTDRRKQRLLEILEDALQNVVIELAETSDAKIAIVSPSTPRPTYVADRFRKAFERAFEQIMRPKKPKAGSKRSVKQFAEYEDENGNHRSAIDDVMSRSSVDCTIRAGGLRDVEITTRTDSENVDENELAELLEDMEPCFKDEIDRQIVTAKHQGYSPAEIAEQLHYCDVETVTDRLTRIHNCYRKRTR
jgi:hypothetical protein